MKEKLERLRNHTPLRVLLTVLMIAAVTFLETYQMHYSVAAGFKSFFTILPVRILLNLAIMFWVILTAKVLLQRWHLALLVTGILATVWSIVNFFVMKFHGSPLFISEFRNLSTALNVAGGYHFAWERRITWLLLLGIANVCAALLLWLLRGKGKKLFSLKEFLLTCGAWVLVSALLYMTLFVWESVKPRRTIGWTWTEGVNKYGYLSAIVEDADNSMSAFHKPEGYSPEKLRDLKAEKKPAPAGQLPDLIVIINESYYDPAIYTELTADVDYMEGFYGIENAVYGRAVTTSECCGTNNTEYEVLTSKSMGLMSMAAPFNYMNLSADKCTLPRLLAKYGYSSVAMHCGSASNYNRSIGYPALGFDEAILGPEKYTQRKNGNRRMLDSDNYEDMIRQYDSMPEGPRLVYLLTFQNHGGYEQNPSELDTVHVEQNFGDLTDDANEFLSSVSLSSKAFRALTEYYKTSDRPVIILMLGDHAPPMVKQFPVRSSMGEADEAIRIRSVPYVLWANYPVDFPEYTDFATSTDLMPMVMQTAGIPTTYYQDYLLQMHEQLPARTIGGYYMDRNGSFGHLEPGNPWYDTWMLGFYMEYNALKGGASYRADLFEP